MSSVVVSFEGGDSFSTESGSLEVTAFSEENIIKVKGSLPVSITGGKFDDKVTLDKGDGTVLGQDGNDLIEGGMGDDIISGGDGNDTLMGGVGADFIFGGEGNDVINSGLPAADADEHSVGDVLKGGAGNDIFEFTAEEFESGAMDQIVDFRDGKDSIKITGVSNRVTYNSNTGIVSIDGDDAIDIGKGLDDIEPTKQDDGSWEIF